MQEGVCLVLIRRRHLLCMCGAVSVSHESEAIPANSKELWDIRVTDILVVLFHCYVPEPRELFRCFDVRQNTPTLAPSNLIRPDSN